MKDIFNRNYAPDLSTEDDHPYLNAILFLAVGTFIYSLILFIDEFIL